MVAAATSLGYNLVEETVKQTTSDLSKVRGQQVNLEIANSELVTNQLGRDQLIRVTRGGVTVTFSRDVRGRASVCVEGEGYAKEELRTMGEELSQRVVQKYIHQRVLDEVRARQFVVVEEQVNEDQSIRLKVRHWSG